METGVIFYIWETSLIRRPSTGPTAKIDEKVAIDDGVDEPIHGANIGIAPKARSYRHRPRDVKQEKHLRQIPKRRKFRVRVPNVPARNKKAPLTLRLRTVAASS